MRKRIRILLMSLLCIFILSGCTEQKLEEKTEITLMHGWGGTLKTHKVMQEIYADFSEQNPDILLKSIPYSDSKIAVEKANDMLSVGKMPDVISTNGYAYFVTNAIKRDMALDLKSYIEADKEFAEEIHPAVLATWQTSSGKLYTIPDAIEVTGYWYNEEYFRQAQIVDEEGKVTPPVTWKEFFVALDKLQSWIDKTKQHIAVCNLEDTQAFEFVFLARLAGEGERGMKIAENSHVKMGTEELVNTMKDLEKLYSYSSNVGNVETARQKFGVGENVIYFNGVWESDVFIDSEKKEEMAYANYPMYNGKSLSYTSPSSGYVLAKQKDKRKEEASVRFLKYMLSQEVQMRIAVETGQAPSNPNIDRGEIKKGHPLLGKVIDVAYQSDVQINTIRSVWPDDKFRIVENYLTARKFTDTDIEHMVQELNKVKNF